MNLQWNKIVSEKRIPDYKKQTSGLSSLRSEVESDYNRIITSASFRRLQDKTQVFPLDNSDFVRTRLTHSLEVASLAKLIGKQVCTKIQEKGMIQEEINVHDIIETLNCAALLHDIGNPPFGHFGEASIREWFKSNIITLKYNGKTLDTILNDQQKLDLFYYEGNAQALRLVSKLHRLNGKYGMHLTSGVLDTIIKYPVSSLEKAAEAKKAKQDQRLIAKKIGYYESESELFKEIKENTGTLGCRNPLTFILEAADDLAYTFADLEDGYKKGMFTYDELLNVITLSNDEKGKEILIRMLADAKLEERYAGVDHSPYKEAIFRWLTSKQLFCVSSVRDAFIANYEAIMSGSFNDELIACCSEGKLIKALKKFAYEKVYCDKAILRVEIMGNEILTFFLDQFVTAILHYDSAIYKVNDIEQKYIALLSSNYLENYHDSTKNIDDEAKIYYKLLLAADYIAGMTDGYARMLYQELKGMK